MSLDSLYAEIKSLERSLKEPLRSSGSRAGDGTGSEGRMMRGGGTPGRRFVASSSSSSDGEDAADYGSTKVSPSFHQITGSSEKDHLEDSGGSTRHRSPNSEEVISKLRSELEKRVDEISKIQDERRDMQSSRGRESGSVGKRMDVEELSTSQRLQNRPPFDASPGPRRSVRSERPKSGTTPVRSTATNEIERLKERNDMLVDTICRYDKALEHLKGIAEMSFGKGSEVDKTKLQNRVREMMSSLVELKDQKSRVLPDSMSLEERSVMGEVKRLRDACNNKDATISAQHTRIRQLTDKLDALGSIAQERKRSSLTSAAASTADSSGSKSGSGRPASDKRYDVDSELMVPASVLEVLEREVRELRTELKQRETALAERTDTAEFLERKMDVLSHSRDTELRRSRRELAAAQAEVAELRSQLSSMETDYRSREDTLRREQHRLRTRLGSQRRST